MYTRYKNREAMYNAVKSKKPVKIPNQGVVYFGKQNKWLLVWDRKRTWAAVCQTEGELIVRVLHKNFVPTKSAVMALGIASINPTELIPVAGDARAVRELLVNRAEEMLRA